MEESEVLKKQIRGNVGTLILNRPERKNALSPEMLVKLHLTLQEWAREETVRTVIVTGGEGKAFSAGYDILAIPTSVTEEDKEILKKANPLELALNTVKRFPFPTIAMMNGYAFGAGLNLCMCCDLRIAADDIKAGMPPAKLGLVYHPEGLKQFIEVLGMARTREIFFTGRTYEGPQLLQVGLADYLVPRAQLAPTARALAEEMAANAPLSLKGMKRILNLLSSSLKLSQEDLQEAEHLVTESFNSEDLKEGQTAFLEKRKPRFVGR